MTQQVKQKKKLCSTIEPKYMKKISTELVLTSMENKNQVHNLLSNFAILLNSK